MHAHLYVNQFCLINTTGNSERPTMHAYSSMMHKNIIRLHKQKKKYRIPGESSTVESTLSTSMIRRYSNFQYC